MVVLVIFTGIGALVVPTVWLGNSTAPELDVDAVNAAMLHNNASAAIAAVPTTFILVCCLNHIFAPEKRLRDIRFSKTPGAHTDEAHVYYLLRIILGRISLDWSEEQNADMRPAFY